MKSKRTLAMLLALCLMLGCFAGCHQHEWAEATCTAPKTCKTCNETEGEPLPHTMQPATCTVPATCSVCGYTEGTPAPHTLSDPTHLTPATCSVCGYVEGGVIPYAEEYGLKFTSDREFSAPFFAYLKADEGVAASTEEVEAEKEAMAERGYTVTTDDTVFQVGDVTVSEPDADGNVQLTISSTADVCSRVHYEIGKEGGALWTYYQFTGFGLFDYYSGYTVPLKSGDVGDEKTAEAEFTYDGVTRSISCVSSSESEGGWTGWEKKDDGTKENDLANHITYTTTVTIPQDYDGLCLCLSKKGFTEWQDFDEQDADTKAEELQDSLKDGDTLDDFWYIRVKDLIG